MCRTSGTYPGAFQRRRFNNEDITVTLPDGVDACDIGTITIWCQPFNAIFTRLAIPRNVFVSTAMTAIIIYTIMLTYTFVSLLVLHMLNLAKLVIHDYPLIAKKGIC